MIDREGRRLGFVRVLAHSSRSQVLEVRRGDERLALKIVFAGDDESLWRDFAREVTALSLVSHPNVVRAVEHGEAAGGIGWVLMPLFDGITLHTRLRMGRALSPRRACRMFADYLAGLGELHRLGIYHRDISPKNLFLARVGKATRGIILDLGRVSLTGGEPGFTGEHLLGTPGYLAPEQILGGLIDARADIFSVGLCLFEALVGSPAVPSLEAMALFDKGVPTLADVRPDLSLDAVSRVIQRATRITPAERFGSAEDFASALAAAVAPSAEEAA